jgi:mannose/fructose-specific phosphotransferase system component IIA
LQGSIYTVFKRFPDGEVLIMTDIKGHIPCNTSLDLPNSR